MNSKYSRLLAGLLTIGILGAYGANTAAAIENSITNAPAATIGRIAQINHRQEISISDGIATPRAIARTIWANNINRIAALEIAGISPIAIANIQAQQIDAELIEIAA